MNPETQTSRHLMPSLRLAAASIVFLGLVYPALSVMIGQSLFSHQANGSLIERDGHAIGSEIVGQPFSGPGYFIGRPSAVGYDPMGVGGSNLAPSNPEFQDAVRTRAADYAAREDVPLGQIPADAITASGAGIDPHISPDNAARQVARVAAARNVAATDVQTLVARHTEGAVLGVFGQPRVNVLMLNLALDTQFSAP